MPSAINREFFNERTVCPVCSGTAVTEVFRGGMTESPVRDFISSHYENQGTVDWSLLEGTDYVLCECDDCHLFYQRNVPNNFLLDRVYNEMIAPAFLQSLETERLTVDNFNRIGGELDLLFRRLGKPPGKVRFLDYGFGHGRWARVARALGATVFATEISEEKKAYAAGIGVEIIADEEVDHLRFDIVHTEQVFEHLVDPAKDFRRLAAVTDGFLKFAVPHSGNIKRLLATRGMIAESPFKQVLQGRALNRTQNTYVAIQPLEHLNAYFPKTVERLAADNGMHVVDRVRRAAVALNFSSPRLFARSAAKAGTMLAKMILAPDLGYYLLSPRPLGH